MPPDLIDLTLNESSPLQEPKKKKKKTKRKKKEGQNQDLLDLIDLTGDDTPSHSTSTSQRNSPAPSSKLSEEKKPAPPVKIRRPPTLLSPTTTTTWPNDLFYVDFGSVAGAPALDIPGPSDQELKTTNGLVLPPHIYLDEEPAIPDGPASPSSVASNIQFLDDKPVCNLSHCSFNISLSCI
jgi:hypothetical protein